jgi:uncharacterized membrane protein YqiK
MLDELLGFNGIDFALLVVIAIFVALIFVRLGLNAFSYFYVVIPPEQVHVIVSRKGKKAYMSRDGYESTYWYFPWWMSRNILPLEQIPIRVDKSNLGLHDLSRIPFRCDVVAWLVVADPIIASERVGNLISDKEFKSLAKSEIISEVSRRLAKDIEPMICSVARTASMKTHLLEIMQDRKKFANNVEGDLDVSLAEWGLHMTSLEVLHIEDDETDDISGENIRGVIKNWELQETKKIDTETRIYISKKDREARLTEAEMTKESEIAEAQNEEESRKRQIEKEQAIGIAEQERELAIQGMAQQANVKKIDAERELEVGKSKYIADSAIESARGEAESAVIRADGQMQSTFKKAEAEKKKVELDAEAKQYQRLAQAKAESTFTAQTGEAQANANRMKLQAEADGIKAKLVAEADGTDQLADAMKKLQEGALSIKTLEILRDIEIAKFTQMAEAIGKSDTKIYAGGMAEILGVSVSPAQGAGIGVTLNSLMENLDDETKEKLKSTLSGILPTKEES